MRSRAQSSCWSWVACREGGGGGREGGEGGILFVVDEHIVHYVCGDQEKGRGR